jgi:uncharacterized membrane protein
MRRILIYIGVVTFGHTILAQSDSLDASFTQLIEQSETYQQYKVIETSELNALWSDVRSEIQAYQLRLDQGEEENAILRNEIEVSKGKISSAETKIAELEMSVGTVNFLGGSLSSGVYHLIVWGIILILLLIAIFIYGLTLKSRTESRKTSIDYKAVLNEYEEFKERSRKKEIKVKRELQTALNNLEELKRGVKH